MTIENPERIWAFTVRGDVKAALAEAPLLASVHQGWGASKPAGYVLASVAKLAADGAHATGYLAGRCHADAEREALRRERDDAVRRHRPFEEVRTFLLSRTVNLLEARGVDVDFIYDELSALDDDDLAMEMQEKQDQDESRREWQADQGLTLSDYVGCFDEPETENAALRRERDALLARVEKLRAACEYARDTRGAEDSDTDDYIRTVNRCAAAFENDDKASAAGKGVG